MTAKSVRRLARSEVGFIVRGQTRGDLHIIAPWCMWPVRVSHFANAKNSIPDVITNGKGVKVLRYNSELHLGAACRRCSGCLKHKKRLWIARAYHESLLSYRTWFGTLTFPPAIHSQAIARCLERAWDDGLTYSTMSESEQHAVEAAVLYAFVDKFFKRLRKKYRFRYLCVAEPHDSGLIHFHLLIHETTPHQIPKRILEEQWATGLSHWRLVDTGDKRAVFYVCKYLSKEPDMRPRASLHYGSPIKSEQQRPNRTAPSGPEGETSPTNRGQSMPIETHPQNLGVSS